MKEYSYEIDKYIVGVDSNGEDGIGLTIATMKDNELHILGSCYGDNARFIDLLIKENQKLKKQLEEINKMIEKCGFVNIEQVMLNYCGLLTQQKKFINYLEDLIKQNETVVEVSKYGLPKNCSKLLIDFYKEVLQNYREIIGGDR